jgi:succinoglycan biosynthesis transport protein ExoP
MRSLNALRAQAVGPSSVGDDVQADVDRLTREVSDLRETHSTLLRSAQEIRLSEATLLNSLSLIEPAELPTVPVRPRVIYNTLLEGVLGLLAGLGIVFLKRYVDSASPTLRQVTVAAELPALAAIGELPDDSRYPLHLGANVVDGAGRLTGRRDGHRSNPYGAVEADAYRLLRARLQFNERMKALRTVLVTSAIAGEGKTTTAMHLALAFADAGFRTLLIDAHLRRPSLHRLFGIENFTGLTPLIVGSRPGGIAVSCGPEA